MWFTFALLAGCQEPFGTDRHDLVGFRIAALTASVGPADVRPRLAVIHDGKAWSAEPLDIRWYWVDRPGDAARIDPTEEPTARGSRPRLSRQGDRLAVLVGDGSLWRRAELDLVDRTEVPITLETGRIDLDVGTVTEEDLGLDPRVPLVPEPSRTVEPGGFLRFEIGGVQTSAGLGRFMATDGTFFELNSRTADWAAGTLTFDDEVLVERTAAEAGPVTHIVLWVNGPNTGFTSADVFIGEVPSGLWIGSRFLPADASTEGRQWATLLADPDSPAGLRATNLEAAAPDALWDTADLGCEVTGLFDPMWLLEQRCSQADLAGQRVLLDASP